MKSWIFDCDGVILDSMYFWNHMTEIYLRKEGVSPEENLSQKLFAMNYDEGCRYIGKNYLPQKEKREIQKELDRLLKDFYYYEVGEKDGVRELFDKIQKQAGRIVIVTSTPGYLVEAALERLSMRNYVEKIFSATDLHLSKSQPQIFQKAIDFLNVDAREIYYVEDGLYAIEMGKKMGFQTIGIYDQESEQDWESIQQKSDRSFRSLNEMKEEKL